MKGLCRTYCIEGKESEYHTLVRNCKVRPEEKRKMKRNASKSPRSEKGEQICRNSRALGGWAVFRRLKKKAPS